MSTSDGRYDYLEVEVGSDSVAIIQDRENEEGWLQSSNYVPIER